MRRSYIALLPRVSRYYQRNTMKKCFSSKAIGETGESVSVRVARRVKERDSWPTFVAPTARNTFKFLAGNANQVILGNGLPSEEELDKMLPMKAVDWATLRDPKPDKLQSTWVGHSTLVVQMGGWNIITDPIFSERCSGVQFAGPQRYRPPACSVEDICFNEKVGIDVCLVSHNHYDHLDYYSVKELAAASVRSGRPMTFVVALGLKKWFENKVPDSLKGENTVIELDWHETHTIEGSESGDKKKLEITGMPMQHWSNRNGFDKDKTLWCGFGVKSVGDDDESSRNFLFSGDTGFFDGLYNIGKKYGPFDLAAIPIGAYEPRWFMKPQHTNPDDAVEMMEAVQAKVAFAIHWGTFPLTIEPIMEPVEKMKVSMESRGKDLSTFISGHHGETQIV
mmetsp:Transcript_23183/g.35259  ORF Transcript_23183/g.35259 Transcript_23183/m.35259 type:complete len:394 (-) Transcript_23183:31-1212(-)